MCLTEFDEVKYGELIREEGRREGRREGIQAGEGRMAELMIRLFSTGREKDAFRAKEDREYREELFREFGL